MLLRVAHRPEINSRWVTCAMLTSLQAEVLAGILKRLLSGVGVSLKSPGINQS